MPKRILSIDDEPEILHCFEAALQAKGYDVRGTTDPVEGLKAACEDSSLALVLLDIRMPGMNGFEFYKALRSRSQVPVLFVTAYPRAFNAGDPDVADLWVNQFADGDTDILYKPFALPVLYEKVEALIGPAVDEQIP